MIRAEMLIAIVGRPPIRPKELADKIGRSVGWVRKECKEKRIQTCPPHTAPYLIPCTVLAAYGLSVSAQ